MKAISSVPPAPPRVGKKIGIYVTARDLERLQQLCTERNRAIVAYSKRLNQAAITFDIETLAGMLLSDYLYEKES